MARILAIEDEEMNREVLLGFLEAAGHQVTPVPGGREGLSLYRPGVFDLVVTDLLMPGMDGLETIKELRRVDPQVKIIAIAASGVETLNQALAVGANRTLEKPFSGAQLHGLVNALLNEET